MFSGGLHIRLDILINPISGKKNYGIGICDTGNIFTGFSNDFPEIFLPVIDVKTGNSFADLAIFEIPTHVWLFLNYFFWI